jgi:hypothetical protein
VFVVSCTDYFTVGSEVILSKTIDREDKELFPDQSNTDIILHLDLNCKSNVKSTYKFWDDRYMCMYHCCNSVFTLNDLRACTFSSTFVEVMAT